ncbi:ABC transporter permease subunit [Marinicellulosiphila megalodicopiae]|uniref:ABC transporter permease subunit n=1 Tax=Marinicellulosiphila megalodicopiae TaxID=2724896 RepID=UPI003BB15020
METIKKYLFYSISLLAPVLIVGLIITSIWVLLLYWSQDSESVSGTYLYKIIKYSIIQAGLSSLLSIVVGFFIARLLVRRVFFGKSFIIACLNASFTMPVMVVIIMVVLFYGRSGFIQSVYDFNVYSLGGILIAHVFLNAPYCARLFLNGLSSQKTSLMQQAALLQFNDWYCFKYCDWPLLKPIILPVFGFIFLICFNSFAIVKIFGSNGITTLEVAIYHAIKHQFDIHQATIYAGFQFVIGFSVAISLLRYNSIKLYSQVSSNVYRADKSFKSAKLIDSLVVVLLISFWGLPLIWVFKKITLASLITVFNHSTFYTSLFNSIVMATLSTLLVLILCLGLVLRPLQNKKGSDMIAMSLFFFPAIVVASGLYIGLKDYWFNQPLMLMLVIFMNALIALPYSYNVIRQPVKQNYDRFKPLMLSLDLSVWSQIKLVLLPLNIRPLMMALSFSWVIAFGDFSMIALMITDDFKTLPLLVYDRLGTHQLQEASVTALVLLSVTILVYLIQERYKYAKS